MFVNRNVKSLKNVKSVKSFNKTKHHKRNKNKKRSINKLSIKHMRGGSGNSGNSGASDASASSIIHIHTLLELIQSKDGTMCEIHYDDVKIICLLGNNNVKLGYDTTQNKECILITYNMDEEHYYNPDAPYYNATLHYYFYTISKQDCLYSKNNKPNSLIDNSVYFGENKGNNNYSKSINTLLLELVDTINILVGVKYCQLIDAATVTCTESGDIKLSLKLKHITKGYGFYNEFGYIYTKAISIDSMTLNQDKKYYLLDLKFANFILTLINNRRIDLKGEYKNLDKQCTNTLKNNNRNLALGTSIEDFLKDFTVFTNSIIKTVTHYQTNNAEQQAKQQAKQQDKHQNITNTMPKEVHNLGNLFNTFIKRYEYLIDDTVSKSELIKETNPIQVPPQNMLYHFAMVKYTKPTITITSLQEEQLSPNPHEPPKPVYLITITKGTKIE